ncbi:glycoside hydrolase family 1 protein, partial (macronuclear) [Tetrahymena thermophila SB210]
MQSLKQLANAYLALHSFINFIKNKINKKIEPRNIIVRFDKKQLICFLNSKNRLPQYQLNAFKEEHLQIHTTLQSQQWVVFQNLFKYSINQFIFIYKIESIFFESIYTQRFLID